MIIDMDNPSNNQPQQMGVDPNAVPPVTPVVSAAGVTQPQMNTAMPMPPFTPPSPTSDINQTPADAFNQPIGVSENPNPSQVGDAPTPFANEEPTTPPKKPGMAIKRLLVMLLLIIGVLTAGYFAFKIFGKILTRGAPTTLTYWGLWENEETLKPILDEYKKTHPNIDIVYSKQSPKQYRERLQAAIARGDGPDIFRFHNSWVPMLIGDLAPSGKAGYSVQDFRNIFYPVASSDLIVKGQVYGAPLMIDGLALYYNEDLLRAAGVTPPTTWDDFKQAVYALSVKDAQGNIVTSGAALGTTGNVEHYSDIVALMMLQSGVDLKKPVSDEAKAALSYYYYFAEPPNNIWSENMDNSIMAFASGKVAMIFAPSWEAFTIREQNKDLKFKIIPVPQLPNTNINWASYWVEGVSSKSKYQDQAWEFLKFLTSKETMIALYTEETKLRPFGEPYSRVDLAQTISSDPYVGAYVREAPTAKSFFLSSNTYDNGINDRMIEYLKDAINSLGQGVAVDAATQTMSQGFNQILTGYTNTSAQ